MPSPFPGIDPFIEPQRSTDFHTRFIAELGARLVELLRPKYEVAVEHRVYVEEIDGEITAAITPDAVVTERSSGASLSPRARADRPNPVLCALPIEEEREEPYLVLRSIDDREIVTVVELLSPSNKRQGGPGREAYLRKRRRILASEANLVELDLLLGGERLPMRDALPRADLFALVRRGPSTKAEVYAWSLADPLPTIPLPLRKGDGDVGVELQDLIARVYDRAGYDYSLDYDLPPKYCTENQRNWINSVLANQA